MVIKKYSTDNEILERIQDASRDGFDAIDTTKPFGMPTQVKKEDCMAKLGDFLIVDSSRGNLTVTLQRTTVKDKGKILAVKNIYSGTTNSVTILAQDGGFIDDDTSFTLYGNDTLLLFCIDVNKWVQIAGVGSQAGGDLEGNTFVPIVAGLLGKSLDRVEPSDGQVYSYDSASTLWTPTDIGSIIGPAGGDLDGTYPDPTVDGLQGRAVASTAPTSNQVLGWNSGSSQWEPKNVSAIVGGDGYLSFNNQVWMDAYSNYYANLGETVLTDGYYTPPDPDDGYSVFLPAVTTNDIGKYIIIKNFRRAGGILFVRPMYELYPDARIEHREKADTQWALGGWAMLIAIVMGENSWMSNMAIAVGWWPYP